LNYLKEQGITEYQEWVTFRHTFSHFHLDIHPIYVEVDRKSEEADRSDWKKLPEKGKESRSGLLSAVKYWYDPTSPEQIGLAQPVKNLLTQFVRNYYG
jgi:A/G-specific adenine glycosylase